MKKLIALILLLVMTFSFTSCGIIPGELLDGVTGFFDSIFGTTECEHDYAVTSIFRANCETEGIKYSTCQLCGENKEEFVPAAHTFGEDYEPSRFGTCIKCNKLVSVILGEGKYSDNLDFTFGEADKAALTNIHNEIKGILESADKYDPSLHALAESGALYDEYKSVEAKYEEYTDLVFDAQGQSSIAMTLYYCDMDDEALKTQYDDMQSYYTQLVSDYYTLSQPWYDSKFRDFFFEGATEEEIKAFLFDSNAYANPEYTALKDRNDKIELEYHDIENPTTDEKVGILYAEMVENNNKIAALLGYDNYLEYAYENVYNRDYTYQDAANITEYIIKYISPLYNSLYAKWNTSIPGLTNADIMEYYSVVSHSFFDKENANELFNNYIDEMDMAFTSNPEKQYSFSDCLNDLVSDGNLFRGSYEGAYVTYIYSEEIPIAYFGTGYDSSTTIAHEFGHYMNEIYNESEYDQSYDLLETHSQGNEVLYVSYACNKVGRKAFLLLNTYQLLNMISTIMTTVQVDCFEQAVYLNHYEGPGADKIMADGKITYDEYDLLYASISEKLGIKKDYRADDYWRYGMTITSPCYYVSYAVSGINALQIYTKIKSESFDAAKESYLKLFTYTDEDPEMTDAEILTYAGLLPYTDENVYVNIGKYCKP